MSREKVEISEKRRICYSEPFAPVILIEAMNQKLFGAK
jgi:hypothetical protein